MSNFLTTRRSISVAQAQTQSRLGRGVSLPFQGEQQGTLTLNYGNTDFSSEDYFVIQTEIGEIGIKTTQAEHCLNLFSSVPFVMTPAISQSEEPDWYVALYNQCLYPSFRALFGHIVLSTAELANDTKPYELTWQQPHSSGSASLLLSNTTLEYLLSRQPWQWHSFLDVAHLTLTQPLRLANTHLRSSQLKQLEIGDIIIPDQPFFSSSGHGSLRVSNHILQLEFIENGTLPTYQVTHLNKATAEELSMYDEHEENDSFEAPQAFSEEATDYGYDTDQVAEHDDTSTEFDTNVALENPVQSMPDTQIALTVCAGEVSLSLQELSQLHVGSVLTATGEMPGHATLYRGNTAVARGELVEVDGRLGVQLTQVLLSQVARSEGAI